MTAHVSCRPWLVFLCCVTIFKNLTGAYTGNADQGIYTAYASGEGCTVNCPGTVCRIELNGVLQPHGNNQPAFYFVTFRYPSFTKLETKEFITFNAGEAPKMTTWINGLDDGTVVVGCSRDDVYTSMDAAAWDALASIGMNVDHKKYRAAYALVGYKGQWPKNMTKSKSVDSGTADVTYTYIIPPAQIHPTILGNFLEVTWSSIGTFAGDYVITARNSLVTGVGDLSRIVPAKNESSVIGPLRNDTWYTVTMQVSTASNNTHVVATSDPYFILVNEAGNCSTGIYQFVMKIDGNKETFKQSNSIWDDTSVLLPEKNSITGFDRLEAKPSAFNSFNAKRICAGMLDLSTNQFNFIQIQTTIQQPMKDFVDDKNGFPTLQSSAWNFLAPQGVPYAEHTCRQGFGVNDQSRKAELGFLGSSKEGCIDANKKNVLIGYGVNFDGTYTSAGSVYLDDSGSKVIKPAFGYLLIPFFVDSVWNEWSQWGSCNAICGYGTNLRVRNSTKALGEGLQLPTYENNTRSCKIVDCPPPPPTNVTVQTIAEDKLLIEWAGIPADQITNTLASYKVEYWKMEDPSIKATTTVLSATSTEISSLEIYTVYCHQVYGVLTSGISGNRSEVVCNSTDESVPIAPPGNITAFNSSSFCLNVTWDPIPTVQAQGIITQYRIYYKLATGASEFYVNTTNNSHTICGLEPYTQYVVKMSGFTRKGEGVISPDSNPVLTDEYFPIEAPNITTKTNTSSTSIEIEWQPLSLNFWRGVPYGYTIYYILHDIYAISGTTKNVSFVEVLYPTVKVELTQLEKYKNYVVWMNAFTIKGRGEKNGSAVEQMTGEDVPLKGIVATAHNTSSFSIQVEWTHLAVPFRLGVITKYTVFSMDLKTGSIGSFEVASNVIGLEISGLLPFHNHSFEVAAWTYKGMGPRGPTVFAFTDEYIPSGFPANFTGINISSYGLLVSWSHLPYDDWRGIPLGYTILYRQAEVVGNPWNTSVVYGRNTLSTIIENLVSYTNYTLKIAAFTIKGNGSFSDAIVVSTGEDVPIEAPNITTKINTSSTSIEIEWQPLSLNFWRGVPYGYTIYFILHDIYAISGTTKNVSFVDVLYPTVNVELTQLEKYKNYVLWMTAFTIKGRGEKNGSAVEQVTGEDVPLKGPVATAHNTSSFSIQVEWTHLAVPFRLGVITKYTVYFMDLKTGSNGSFEVASNVMGLEISNLLPFHNHSFEVAAWTYKGMGPRGPTVFAFTDEYIPSGIPANFTGVNISSYDLLLSWSHMPYDDWRGIPLGFTILYRQTEAVGNPWNTSVVYGRNSLSTIIGSLVAYTNHTLKIAAFTIKGNGNFSDTIVVSTGEDAPYESPRNITPAVVNATAAVIRWLPPQGVNVKGIVRYYKVVYQSVYSPDDFVSKLKVNRRRRRRSVISQEVVRHQINITVPSDQFEVQINNLQGYTNYSVQVLAITLHEGPLTDSLYLFTKETVPTMSPVNVTVEAETYTSLMVKWRHVPPAYAHGIIKGYIVYYEYGNHSNATAFSDKQFPTNEHLELVRLKIFDWYTVQVAAYTSVGVGVRSSPIHARTGEYYPSHAPRNVSAESFMLPHEIDVKWLPVPIQFWRGIPLGYNVILTAHSAGGVELRKNEVFSITRQVPPTSTSYKFTNLMSFYKYSVQVSAFTKVADGPKSELAYVETCSIANKEMYSSWIDNSPLVKYNPSSPIPDGLVPTILSGAMRHCSGTCLGLGVKGNATVNYMIDGKGMASRKSDLAELMHKMTPDTEFFFPVSKPKFSNDKYKFIELVKVDTVVLVEGKPLVNRVGSNVSSSIFTLSTVLLCFLLFCVVSGCILWMLETWNRTGQLSIFSLSGILDGFYWAWVTATTVGFGDITPISIAGKCFSMFWALAGLILCGFLTGALSSVLTASENPLAAPSVPKTGIGMVLDTWELKTAKRSGMPIDKNFTSYSDLLDAVADGTVKYGLIDASVSKIWTPKLVKEKIDVKKEFKLDGSLGVFASGNARQLHACFETYIKEESTSILNAMQETLQKEAAKVAKLLAVPENVSIQVTPKKPEFFSWGSVTMQAYVKTGALALGIFWILGIGFEVVKHFRRRIALKKVTPKIPRIVKSPATIEASDYGSSFVKDDQEEPASSTSLPKVLENDRPKSVSAKDFVKGHSEEETNKLGSKEDASDLLKDSKSDCQSPWLEKPLFFENMNENDEAVNDLDTSSKQSNTNFIKHPTSAKESKQHVAFNEQTITADYQEIPGYVSVPNEQQESASLPCQPQYVPFGPCDTQGLVSVPCSQPTGASPLFEMQDLGPTPYQCQKFASAPVDLNDTASYLFDRPDLSNVPDDESILSYCCSDYYDNEALEMETRQLIAGLEERFEALVCEMTTKHESEIWQLQNMKSDFDKKRFGGVYKYFDPQKFSAPW